MAGMKHNKPEDAVAGLTEVLLALGEQLREANHSIGRQRVYGTDEEGWQYEPVLFFDRAEVELTLTATRSVDGGVQVWVLSGDGSRSDERTMRLKIDLNGPQGREYEVGM